MVRFGGGGGSAGVARPRDCWKEPDFRSAEVVESETGDASLVTSIIRDLAENIGAEEDSQVLEAIVGLFTSIALTCDMDLFDSAESSNRPRSFRAEIAQ